MDLVENRLSDLRRQFIDITLAICPIAGVITQGLTFLRDYPDFVTPVTWLRVGFINVLILFYFLRNRFSDNSKIYFIFIVLISLFTIGTFNLGFYSTLKLFIVSGPVTMIFLLPIRYAIICSVLCMLIYVAGSMAVVFGFREYLIPPALLQQDIYHWMLELCFSLFCVFTVIYLIHGFRNGVKSSILEIESGNKLIEKTRDEIRESNENLENLIEEKTRDLQQTVEGIAAENRKLKTINAALRESGKEIQQATSKLDVVKEKIIVSEKLSSLGLLTAGVCHEVKNPLNHIYGTVSVMKKNLEGLNAGADEQKLVNAVGEAAARIKVIIDSLNQFDHHFGVSATGTDLLRVIHNCRSILSGLIHKGIEFNFTSVYSSVEINLPGDALHQIILNVLQNALEAIAETGVVTIHLIVSDAKAIVEISDTGSGIPDELLSGITDPFFTTKPAELHTGLGLYQVQKLMNDLGGRLNIDSEYGEGTVVRMVFNGTTKVALK